MSIEPRWVGAQRVEGWVGEARVNLIRLVALVGLYGHQLSTVYLFQDDATVTGDYHRDITVLVLMWFALGLGVYFMTSRRIMPPALKFGSLAGDLVLLTLMMLLSDGPKSPLVVVYMLVVGSTALRLSLPLVWVGTLGGVASYLFVLGEAFWFRPEHNVPRAEPVVLVIALAVMGLLAGQTVRQARRISRGHAVVVGAAPAEINEGP